MLQPVRDRREVQIVADERRDAGRIVTTSRPRVYTHRRGASIATDDRTVDDEPCRCERGTSGSGNQALLCEIDDLAEVGLPKVGAAGYSSGSPFGWMDIPERA